MAEIKNNFLGSKMNKDIDDRLLPPNEYRDAYNIQVNTSEGSDTGTLQNVLGNNLLEQADFNTLLSDELQGAELECIGVLVDNTKDDVYLFLTSYRATGYNPPYSPDAKNYICKYNVQSNIYKVLVSGSFLNFHYKRPIIGVNILEDLLFFTDNRNQPRKINVSKASDNRNYYQTEDQISVAKLSPLYPMELYKASDKAAGEYETTMHDVVSPEFPDGVTNTYLDENYVGDPSYLENRMVRFSYRYKFDDGEYSIFAPFTQIAYIPKQDGYFLEGDEEEAFRSTIVKFMQNKVNKILLRILLPENADELESKLKITEIDILYKESDNVSVNVVDSIPISTIVAKSGSSDVYEYEYQSKKPFKTLPERDLIRVYDKVPIKALAQEIVSNRVVYSNYQDKASYPKYLDFNVGYSERFPFGLDQGEGTSIIEYPNHTLKQNRNYQVGVILSDKFGRQSGVILSDSFESDDPNFGGSSLYVPYIDDTVNKKDWPGYSLKVLFNNPILSTPPDINTGWPGLYNGDPNSLNYNPTGWYSYKIVVKQTEQEYYNVYLPGVMDAYPEATTTEAGKTAHAVLINDNINKVPRDLKEVGPTQTQFRSSVILYGRVNNNETDNEQNYPGNTYSFVNTIATNSSLFNLDLSSLPVVYDQFYQVKSNPLIARFSTQQQQGVTSASNVKKLAIFETKPVESRLDIYWETSSVGLISDLNAAISENTGAITSIQDWHFTLAEDAAPGATAATGFYFVGDIPNVPVIPTSITFEVRNLANDLRTDKFLLEPISGTIGEYRIKVKPNQYFYYGVNASQLESYVFYFTVTSGTGDIITNLTATGTLGNIAPTITNTDTMLDYNSAVVDVYQFNALNGSNINGTSETLDLDWSITSQEYESNGVWYTTNIFSIVTDPATPNGMLRDVNQAATGFYRVTVSVSDAGGLSDSYQLYINYIPDSTYDCVPSQGGCQAVTGNGGQYATLEECQAVCATCNYYILHSNAPNGLQVSAWYNECSSGNLVQIQFNAGTTAYTDCARTNSVFDTQGNVFITTGSPCSS